ncbi:MAG: PAS domain-containing protein, partial [Rubrivivax sp.]
MPDAAAPPEQAVSGLDIDGALALLQGSPCAMALCSADGRLLWCNATLLRTLHRSDPAPVGLMLAELLALSPDDAQRLQASLGDVSGSGGAAPELCVHGGMAAPSWWRLHVAALADGRRAISLLPLDEQRRQALQASRLGELLDLAQDFGRLAVWERDVRSLKGRWDRHVYRFWGLPEGDGTPDFALALKSVVAEDRAAFELAFRDSIRLAGTYSHRYRVRAPDGVVRQLHSQWVVKDGANGRPDHVVGILMDDTEAWTLARSHGQAVEQLALAVELGRIAVWRTDLRTARVQFSNKAYELLGMVDRGGDMGHAEVLALIHPDDRPSVTAAVDQALASGRPVDVEARFRHADGGWRHLLTRRVLQRDVDGKPVALMGVGLDLSERVESSRRETELVRQFELTARAAGIGYWSVAAATGQARWSEQTLALHGLPPDAPALPMQPWLARFVHPDDREAVRQRFFDWVQSGTPLLEQEFRVVRCDGAVRHVLSHSRLEGPPRHYDFYGVLTDVSERRAAEAALHQASERAALATL